MVGLDWDKQAPEWANALISNDSGSRFYWVEQWGGSCSRFEEWESKRCKYLDEYHQVPSRINMVQPHNWILMAKRQADWGGKGNPPVGVVCEYQRNDVYYQQKWVKVIPMYFGETLIVLQHWSSGNEYTEAVESCVFRPIKTQEQIAAEEREKAIDEMFDIVDGFDTGLWSQVERLYDKGYRLTKTEE